MKFLTGLIAGGVISIAIFTGLLSLAKGKPLRETQGFAADFNRKREIALAIPGSKIILVGGSSVDQGISAESVSEKLDMPTVNYGLISPLGAHYIFHKTKEIARPGDFVVISLEYHCYDWMGPSLWLDPIFINYVTSQDGNYLDKLSPWNRWNILARVNTPQLANALLRGKRNSVVESSSEEAFNGQGDRISNSKNARPVECNERTKPVDQLVSGFSPNPKGFPAIRNFLKWAAESDVTVIATFPNVGQNSAYQFEKLNKIEKQIQDFYEAHGVPVAGTLAAAMFPEEDLFDSPFHLVQEAVLERTNKLTIHLDKIIKNYKESN